VPHLPSLAGTVERRLLVNYRVDPDVMTRLLPRPLRPQLVRGWAVAGLCLIRLGHLRPRRLPAGWGVRSENAAHRVAVEWDTPDGTACGVFVARRDTGSWVNAAVGGRAYPGVHGRARFRVREAGRDVYVACSTVDDGMWIDVHARRCGTWPGSALFDGVDEASAFFRRGADGYSPSRSGGCLEGLRLETLDWRVEPVEVVHARSSYFDDGALFPPGSVALDNALLMREVAVRWQPLPRMSAA